MSKKADSLMIQHYLEGKLTPREMHELERQALDDPFLSDALEGYSKTGLFPGSQLSLLQRQLESRIALQAANKNAFYFSWQRLSVAAAAGLLFITAGILFWMKPGLQQVRSKEKVEVRLDLQTQKEFGNAPDPQSSPAVAVAKVKAKQKRRHNRPADLQAPAIASLSKVSGDTSSVLGEITTVKQNDKNAFEDFVGNYPQTRTDLILTPESTTAKKEARAAAEPETAAKMLSPGEYEDFLEDKLRGFAGMRNFNGKIRIGFELNETGKVSVLKIRDTKDNALKEQIVKVITDGPAMTTGGAKKELTIEFKKEKEFIRP